jgi:hypothetical protein
VAQFQRVTEPSAHPVASRFLATNDMDVTWVDDFINRMHKRCHGCDCSPPCVSNTWTCDPDAFLKNQYQKFGKYLRVRKKKKTPNAKEKKEKKKTKNSPPPRATHCSPRIPTAAASVLEAPATATYFAPREMAHGLNLLPAV